MAFLNLLGGTFIGRLGTYYGSRSRTGVKMRVVPFSKAPATEPQVANVRCFEALNRVAAIIARVFWDYLNLNQGDMHKHNRVVAWLKACIVTHVFVPADIATVIPEDGSLEITDFTINAPALIGHLTFTLTAPYPSATGGAYLFVIFDQYGYRVAYGVGDGSGSDFDFSGIFVPGRTYYAMAFRSDQVGGVFVPHGYSLASVAVPSA